MTPQAISRWESGAGAQLRVVFQGLPDARKIRSRPGRKTLSCDQRNTGRPRTVRRQGRSPALPGDRQLFLNTRAGEKTRPRILHFRSTRGFFSKDLGLPLMRQPLFLASQSFFEPQTLLFTLLLSSGRSNLCQFSFSPYPSFSHPVQANQ